MSKKTSYLLIGIGVLAGLYFLCKPKKQVPPPATASFDGIDAKNHIYEAMMNEEKRFDD